MMEQTSGPFLPTSPTATQSLHGSPRQQSGLRSEFLPNGNGAPMLEEVSQLSPRSGIEARDYMNGGLPHELPNTSAIGNVPTANILRKQIPAPLPPVPSADGTSTPPSGQSILNRRSVAFSGPDGTDSQGHTRQNSLEDETDVGGKDRKGQSLMSKLKALTLPAHGRSASHSNIATAAAEGTSSAPQTPGGARTPRRTTGTLEEEGSDIDADAEETADENAFANATRERRKKRVRRPQNGSAWGTTEQSLEETPPMPRRRSLRGNDSPIGAGSRFQAMMRRSTLPEQQDRVGMSEGEGRDHLHRQGAWRRGSSFFTGGRHAQSYVEDQTEDYPETPTASSRPGNLRRLTPAGGGVSDGEAMATTPRRPLGSRAATFGAARWQMVKQGLKMLGTKKEEHRIDYLKSAELMAELRAGAPAALMLASMIQRDERGNKRIPVLLEQLKLKITDAKSLNVDKESERHVTFQIELEYGSGDGRMKWSIVRSLTDFIALHTKYKLQANSDKLQRKSDISARPKQPSFPKEAFPFARKLRLFGDSDEEDADPLPVNSPNVPETPIAFPPALGEDTAGEQSQSDVDRPGASKRRPRRPSFTMMRRRSTAIGDRAGSDGENQATAAQKKAFTERQKRKLEQYLQEMIRWLIFRADSNRLCKFLELSALGVRLSAEGGYHGKEGFLSIQTANGVDFRKIFTPSALFNRNSAKWFLVRSNYIVCVDSPENMHIYDVFLLDPTFMIEQKHRSLREIEPADATALVKSKARHPQHHRLKIQNSERKMKLLAKNERMLAQFEDSIRHMMDNSSWSKPNRFGSFAPIRKNVFAQWLVDGRDYMWNVSRAINEAKDVIYIHDWWLSPQLYMRRPAAISQKWRLDRLLRKKAREGVKVFVIVYRNVEAAVPIDSEFTKFCLLDLHPNIFVQRSPNQFKKNQFFYAHHEKICIVDHSVAFVGGIDLCFGRWDTPQHSVTDDKPTGFENGSDEPKDADHCQLWPGKDYSNPRVQDFYDLQQPYAEMYDRTKTPRMPWHDISMQIVGQPARDLTRHFVQRWNYVLRGRKPTRPTPFLLPPPDYIPEELENVGLTGTCEVQILRSASNWSLGITGVEHSIMTAYCKMIEESDHFVYMENQFFITSTETMNTKIVNKIGDALVERAIRAFKNNESWRCIIIIPLMPGFQNTVDAADGTSVRLIMQCQFRSISRGEDSIFARLRAAGLEPEEFITFYSLRAWGKIGPNKTLVTEQLYIHAKAIIVDDRIALIGSANINERSMLGSRDSETAAVVRDTDMLWSYMDGEPYLVGRFAHTLRMRLMREHLGLDVDAIMEEERAGELDREQEGDFESNMDKVHDYRDGDVEDIEHERLVRQEQAQSSSEALLKAENYHSINHQADLDNPNIKSDKTYTTHDKRVTGNVEHEREVDGLGPDHWKDAEASGLVRGRDSVVVDGNREVLVTSIAAEGKGTLQRPKKLHVRATPAKPKEPDVRPSNDALPPQPRFPRRTTEQLGLPQLSQLPALPIIDDTDIGGPPVVKDSTGKVVDTNNPLMADLKRCNITKDCMRDPLNDTFFDQTWRQVAENNTKIFRRVFRCNPDNEVTNWHEYTEFQAYAERFAQSQNGAKSAEREGQEHKGKSGPPGSQLVQPAQALGQGIHALSEKLHHSHPDVGNSSKESIKQDGRHPQGTVAEWADRASQEALEKKRSRGDTIGSSNYQQPSISDEKSSVVGEATTTSPTLPAGDQPFPSLDEPQSANPEKPRTTFATTVTNGSSAPLQGAQGSQRRRRRGTTRSRKGFSASDDLISKTDAEALLQMVQGSLVVFPNDWLKAEEHNNNWLYQVDMVAPLQIYD